MVQKDKWAWAWIPVLYFTQGLPYVLVVTVSVIMYKKLGVSNEDIGFYTSLLYLPWVLKPLWSPFVDLKSTKRKWFLSMQLVISDSHSGGWAELTDQYVLYHYPSLFLDGSFRIGHQ